MIRNYQYNIKEEQTPCSTSENGHDFSKIPRRRTVDALKFLWLPALFSSAILVLGCQSTSFRVPPAQTPQFVSTGIQVSGASGATTAIGELISYCNDYTARSGPNGRGFYVTVKMPTLNTPEVVFAGTAGDYWGALTDPTSQSLSQGPKPISQQQIQRLQGNYVGYFIHDDFLTGNDYHVVIGILLGKGVPEQGILAIRSVNTDPQNTGLQARSDPLEIAITEPVEVEGSISPNPAREGRPVQVNWNATHADQVEISGPGFAGGTALPISGHQTVTAQCTGDRDSASVSYQVKARRVGCPTSRTATRNLSVTVNTPRKITQFEGIPRLPAEGSSFTLRWKTAGASGVTLTGPNGFSHNATGSMGQTTVTAPGVSQCMSLENFHYQMTATWPQCGMRTETALVSVTAATRSFTLVESGGPQCRSSNNCIVQARSLSEARNCASGTCGSIQQGCTWR